MAQAAKIMGNPVTCPINLIGIHKNLGLLTLIMTVGHPLKVNIAQVAARPLGQVGIASGGGALDGIGVAGPPHLDAG